jgi:hypothetical protein
MLTAQEIAEQLKSQMFASGNSMDITNATKWDSAD